MSVEEIVQHILLHCQDLTRGEVVKAIEMKKAASSGFLTDEAAARLVAAELGVEIKLKETLPKIHIHQLVSGLNDVTVSGRVLNVNKPHSFQRSDGKGQVARLLIADKTGCIQVVLWNDKAELAREIRPRQIVKVLHGYVRKSRGGEMELHVGQRGDVQIAPGDVDGRKNSNNVPCVYISAARWNTRQGHAAVTKRRNWPNSCCALERKNRTSD